MNRPYVIDGRPRSGKNHTQRVFSRKRGAFITVKSEASAAWQFEAIRQLSAQRLERRSATILGPVYVEYIAYQSADVADIDNIECALFDAIAKAGLIANDKNIVDHRGRKAIDRERPRIEVTVTEI